MAFSITMLPMKFYSRLFAIALPIILQQFISASLNLFSGLAVGQLGEVAVAAVGLCNQIFFVLNIILFGISSGSAIFTAQMWGKRDIVNIRRVLGLSLIMGLLGASVFFVAAVFFPGGTLGIYSLDPAVIAMGSPYLRLVGLSYLFTAVTFSLASVMRSTGDVRTPLLVSMVALTINTLLTYGLVFGKLGMPQMGVNGAALATCIARILESVGLVAAAILRRSPVIGTLREMWGFNWAFVRAVLSRALPVAFNETLWSIGATTYNIIYARIGTDAIAAVNITSTIENMAFVLFIGISDATAILVGNQIGAGDEQEAFTYARNSLFLAVGGAVLVGMMVFFFADNILYLYKVDASVTDYARRILVVMSFTLWIKVTNFILFVGVLRAGGDTRFGFLLDSLSIWLVGVPIAYIGAFVLGLPVYWVYLMVVTEEAFKWVVVMVRFFSKRWIQNVTHAF